jgi:Flp pilus assembly protein protease CpaA
MSDMRETTKRNLLSRRTSCLLVAVCLAGGVILLIVFALTSLDEQFASVQRSLLDRQMAEVKNGT